MNEKIEDFHQKSYGGLPPLNCVQEEKLHLLQLKDQSSHDLPSHGVVWKEKSLKGEKEIAAKFWAHHHRLLRIDVLIKSKG